MGTRCLTIFQEKAGEEIAVMYRQYDGYPEGHGEDLIKILKDRSIVNGYGKDDSNAFNGMPCLAAQVVAHFKDGIGGFYLYPAKTRDCGEEYRYTISETGKGKIRLAVDSGYGEKWKRIFTGSPDDWDLRRVNLRDGGTDD